MAPLTITQNRRLIVDDVATISRGLICGPVEIIRIDGFFTTPILPLPTVLQSTAGGGEGELRQCGTVRTVPVPVRTEWTGGRLVVDGVGTSSIS